MTGFGSFDNSMCKRVLDLLEPGDLTLGQVVIKRVAVVELGVNNGSGDGGGSHLATDLKSSYSSRILAEYFSAITLCSRISNST